MSDTSASRNRNILRWRLQSTVALVQCAVNSLRIVEGERMMGAWLITPLLRSCSRMRSTTS